MTVGTLDGHIALVTGAGRARGMGQRGLKKYLATAAVTS
jgi:hypothetical protein